jgi:hypothetical protein
LGVVAFVVSMKVDVLAPTRVGGPQRTEGDQSDERVDQRVREAPRRPQSLAPVGGVGLGRTGTPRSVKKALGAANPLVFPVRRALVGASNPPGPRCTEISARRMSDTFLNSANASGKTTAAA